ncbi:MAG: hypothetical protein ABIG46_00230 [Candidatus Omnitrophota bacterium]
MSASLSRALAKLEVGKMTLILALSVFLPFTVHLFPLFAGLPLGARLLPMFYAPFIALFFCRAHVAIVTAVLAPILNHVITGHPVAAKIPLLNLELSFFVLFAYFLLKRFRVFSAGAPLAYIISKLCAAWLWRIISGANSMEFLAISLLNSLPGVAVLFVINFLLINYRDRNA